MNVCSGHGRRGQVSTHEDIVHEGRDCPFCAYIREADDVLSACTKQIGNLEAEVEKLQAEIERLSEPLISTMEAVKQAIREEKGQAPNEQKE